MRLSRLSELIFERLELRLFRAQLLLGRGEPRLDALELALVDVGLGLLDLLAVVLSRSSWKNCR